MRSSSFLMLDFYCVLYYRCVLPLPAWMQMYVYLSTFWVFFLVHVLKHHFQFSPYLLLMRRPRSPPPLQSQDLLNTYGVHCCSYRLKTFLHFLKQLSNQSSRALLSIRYVCFIQVLSFTQNSLRLSLVSSNVENSLFSLAKLAYITFNPGLLSQTIFITEF